MIDALRMAVSDPRLGRVPTHLTLVPPVNVPEASLGLALARLRAGAATVTAAPLRLELGRPRSFLPDNPVVFLPVGGDLRALEALRDTVFEPPLARPLAWPWVPHVTLLDGADPERIGAIVDVLAGFSAEVNVDVVHLLEEGPDRVWRPLAGERLGSAGVVGRGGLALTISEAVMADPEVAAFLALYAPPARPGLAEPPLVPVGPAARRPGAAAAGRAAAATGPGPAAVTPGVAAAVSATMPVPVGSVLLVGRRDDQIVGVAVRNRRWLEAVVVAPEHRRQGIGAHLLARAVDGRSRTLADWGAAGAGGEAFLERHGWVPAEHLLVRELPARSPVDP